MNEETKTVTARPDDSQIVMCAFLGVFLSLALGMIAFLPGSARSANPNAATPEQMRPIFWIALAASVALTALMAIATRRTFVTASPDGLTWRFGFGRETFAPWSAVDDFHLTPPVAVNARIAPDARILVGKKTVQVPLRQSQNGMAWRNHEAFRDAVARALPDRGGWKRLGTRDRDLPKTFGYGDPATARACLAVFSALGFGLLGLILYMVCANVVRQMGRIGWEFALLMGTLMLALAGALAFGLFLAVGVGLRERLGRSGQSITADRDGLRFSDGARDVAMCWSEIYDYRLVTKRDGLLSSGETSQEMVVNFLHRIETADEHVIEFSDSISSVATLAALVVDRAVGADRSGWTNAPRVAPALPDGVRYGPLDSLVFSHRTRLVALVLWGGFALAVSVMGMPFVLRTFQPEPPPLASALNGCVPGICLLLATLYGFWRWRAAFVSIDPYGITVSGILKSKRLRWDEIKRVEGYVPGMVEIGRTIVARDGRKIRYLFEICGADRLKKEIDAALENEKN